MIRLQLTEQENMGACCAMDRYGIDRRSSYSRLRALWHRFVRASVTGGAIGLSTKTALLLRRALKYAAQVQWNDPATPPACAAVLLKLERGMK